ncbi:MAG: SDR family oxidoreductase [Ketobacteraceae bacterium]|nr:SDR family oxidoreductase [Ketobacteraceae bacterium]
MDEFKGKTALITGASSGIGESFARLLAAAGANLVLVARREERLQALARELASGYGIETEVIPRDLGVPGAATELYRQIEERGLIIDILINNAGFGIQGDFLDAPLESHHQTINVNVMALHDLTWLFARDMVGRGSGQILLVASIAAFMPVPRFTTYAATKAYVLNLGDSLAKELAPRGVKVTTLCPGGTATEFFEHSGQEFGRWRALAMMSSDSVAKAALEGLVRGRHVVVPGLLYKLSLLMLRLVPRRLQAVVGQLATD